jgi:hypothetical protein
VLESEDAKGHLRVWYSKVSKFIRHGSIDVRIAGYLLLGFEAPSFVVDSIVMLGSN